MKRLTINKIEGYKYYVSDENKEYILNMEFYGIDDISVNDVIYMSEKHLKDNLSLLFGPLSGIYGKEINQEKRCWIFRCASNV